MELISIPKSSYKKLKPEIWFDEEDDYDIRDKVIRRLRNASRFRRVHVRRRLRVKIPSLKRFFKRKVRVVKGALCKVYKRFKEGQSHFGDLFAGNYLFMQVTPSRLKYVDKGKKDYVMSHEYVHGLYARYSMGRIA